MKYIYLLLLIIIVFPKFLFSQEFDTLHIYIVGEFKKSDKYQLRYKRELVCNFGGKNKIIDTNIVFNISELRPYDFMEIDIYKKQRFGSNYWFYRALVYYPEFNYVEIYYLPYNAKDFLVYYFPCFTRIHTIGYQNKLD